MTYRLFLDDERFPPDIPDKSWVIARSYDQAVFLIRTLGIPEFMSLDHDLGDDMTGYDFVKWFCDYVHTNSADLSNFDYYVHSQNPIGKKNIESYLSWFLIQDEIAQLRDNVL